MRINEIFDCLVTPIGSSVTIKVNDLIWGRNTIVVQSFNYVYNKFLKPKGCITSVPTSITDNELKGYNSTALVKYYCTPNMLEIIDIIQEKTLKVLGDNVFEGFNISRTAQSLIINASKLNIEEDNLRKFFCQFDDDAVGRDPKIVGNNIEFHYDNPVFYGFKGDNCSRTNVFKFLFNGAVEIIEEVQENFIPPFASPVNSNVNWMDHSFRSNPDEDNLYANYINIAIGFVAIVISTGIGYLGYKLYQNRKVEHTENTDHILSEFDIEHNNVEISAVGIIEDVV